jgi:RHS repeat-associated protein
LNRKTQTYEQIGTNAEVLLSQSDYNEIGQLKTKHLHSTNSGSSFLQDINYSYNERGWLKTSSAQLFAMQLSYDDGTTPEYNGNISNQYWGTPNNLTKSYAYNYDPLNRLTDGTSISTGFSETGITYDNMGNLLSLNRTGAPNAVSLTYTGYTGNQLNLVKNNGSTFRTYAYDNNGNATTDGNGNTITYNLLNLPQSIPGKSLTYTYDAAGAKLRKVSSGTTTEYIDGIQYTGATIDFVQTEEGRILNPTGTPNYEYTLTDHLGNSRVSFDSSHGSSTALQTEDYYPFGLIASQPTVTSPPNHYLYNGKELQPELGTFDYDARQYDPVIARWTTIDPLAEKSRRWSPYVYGLNDPIGNIDPDGMQATYNWSTGTYQDGGKDVSWDEVQQQYGIGTANSCCEVKPAPVEKSNTFVNESGELIKKGSKFTGLLELAGYAVIELFSSHDDPAQDLQDAYNRAAQGNFRNSTANQGFFNELMRNGYRAPGADEEDDDKYIYRGGYPTNGNLTPRVTDLDGLSTFTTAAQAKAKLGVKIATKISVNSLRSLGLQVDYQGTHASIRPATAKELAVWAASKAGLANGGNTNINTKKVQASVRGIE